MVEHESFAIEPDPLLVGRQRMEPVREGPSGVWAKPCDNGLLIKLRGEHIDAMDDQSGTIRASAILARAKQLGPDPEERAGRSSPAYIDLYRRTSVRLPRTRRLVCVQ